MQNEPRLARIREVLAPALADRMRGTLRDRVEGVWLALGGPAGAEDATELEDAEIFFDELERLEQAGELEDFSALGDSLSKLYALPDVNAGPEAVEIMTIHKAKGLEFDTVIVPGLDRPPLAGRRPLFAFKSLPSPSGRGAAREGPVESLPSQSGRGAAREAAVESLPSPLAGEGSGERGQRGLLLAPIDETGGEKEPLYKYVRQLDREAEDIEAGRLFYVAATRAKARLHLLTCVKVDEHGAVKMPSKRSLLGLAWQALQGFSLPSPLPGEEPAERTLPSARLRRLFADFELPRPPEPTAWTSPEEEREEERIEFSWVGETARHVGTVAHAWLRRMADDQLAGWNADRIASLRPTVGRQLAARGVGAAELDAAAEQVLTALANTIGDARGRWVLGPHPEAKSEYRIRVHDRRFVVDRVFRDQEGVQWVVDYKTSRHEGANLEAFLDEERKRYAAQLDAYSSALGGARRGLYFPLHKGWRAW
jgi:ATP-dependent exoDNAse (exonuclease V) beta subunit